ncbi:unnamed protein product, partial [Staurois parvus]
AQYTLLTTTYQSPAPTRCTYPIFNPVKKSSVATAPSFVPSLSSSLPTAALSTYKPALTSCTPVTKTRKKQKFFPTNTILPVFKPVSLPSENPPSMVQPDTLMPDVPVYPTQLDVSTDDPMPAVEPDDPLPTVKPDNSMPDDPMTRCPLSNQTIQC